MMRNRIKGMTCAAAILFGMHGIISTVFAEEQAPGLEGSQGFVLLSDESAYANVRAEASTDTGEVVGLLRTGDSVVIESVEEDGWYRIRSGEVEGYVASRLIATGEDAESIADLSASTFAMVNAASLNIRAETHSDSEIIGTLSEGERAEVAETYDGGAFVKVFVDPSSYGYVSADYVELVTEYSVGRTLEQIEAESSSEEGSLAISLNEGEAAAGGTTYDPSQDYSDSTYATAQAEVSPEATDSGSSEWQSTAQAEQSSDSSQNTQTETYQNADNSQSAGTEAYQTADSSQNTQAETESTSQSEAAVSAGSASGSAIASYACQYVGIPYVWGGTSLTSGVDCSGFTMAVFSAFGISLPHYAASQYGCGTPVSLSDLSAGDLVFYNGSSGAIEHVAIYVGGGSIVHARGTGYGVCYSSLYYDTPDAACRIV